MAVKKKKLSRSEAAKARGANNKTGRNVPKGLPQQVPIQKHAGGRPTKLTEELIEAWEKLQKSSFYNDTILCMLDIARHNVREWQRRGKLEFERLTIDDDKVLPDPKEAIYLKFYLMIKKTMARKEVSCVRAILRAGRDPKYWTAMAWLLERTMPHKYGSNRQEIKEMKKMLDEVCKQLQKKETEEMIDEALKNKEFKEESKEEDEE